MKKYPQSLINVRVTDKYRVEENVDVKEVMLFVVQIFQHLHQLLLQPWHELMVLFQKVLLKFDQPLVRVMVEAATDEDAERFAQQIADVVQDKMGLDK
jgi:phosphoglucosamine mutase